MVELNRERRRAETGTRVVLECSETEAKSLVESVFEEMDAINEYYVGEDELIAKTGPSLTGWGVTVTIQIVERRQNEIVLEVHGEKEFGLDRLVNPEPYKNTFINKLEQARSTNDDRTERTKRVESRNDLYNGTRVSVLVLGTICTLGIVSILATSRLITGLNIALLPILLLYIHFRG